MTTKENNISNKRDDENEMVLQKQLSEVTKIEYMYYTTAIFSKYVTHI